MIAYPVHIVIRLDARTDDSPRFHGPFSIWKNCFILLTSADHSFPRLRKKHDAIRFRRTGIFEILFKERHRIDIISRLCFEHIQMEMRTE